MTINEILQEAIEKPENWFTEGPFRGGVNWNYMDADLWTHPDAGDFTDQQLFDGFEEWAENNDPMPGITAEWRDSVNSVSDVETELIHEVNGVTVCEQLEAVLEREQLEMEAELAMGI